MRNNLLIMRLAGKLMLNTLNLSISGKSLSRSFGKVQPWPAVADSLVSDYIQLSQNSPNSSLRVTRRFHM